MANIKDAVFYKNIKPEYDKSYVMTTGWNTSKDDLTNLLKSWGFSNVYITGTLEWRIEENPTYGPSLLIFDGGSNVEVRCLDDGFAFLKCKSKQDNYYKLLSADSSGYVSLVDYLETDYVAPGAYSVYISDLGFARHVKDCFLEDGYGLFMPGGMLYSTEVDNNATSITTNETGIFGSGQYSIPSYKANNINLNAWGFPLGAAEYSGWDEGGGYRFTNLINFNNDVYTREPNNFLFSQSPVQMIYNSFNNKLGVDSDDDDFIECLGENRFKLWVGSHPTFSIKENERVVLYTRSVYNAYVKTTSNNVRMQFTNMKSNYVQGNSSYDYTIEASVSGGVRMELSPDRRYETENVIKAVDITDELRAMKQGDELFLSEFKGKSVSKWAKRVYVLKTFSGASIKSKSGKVSINNSGSQQQRNSSNKVMCTWNWKITGSIEYSFQVPTFSVYTIPNSLSDWYSDQFGTGSVGADFNFYANPTASNPTINCSLNAFYAFGVPGNVFPYEDHLQCPTLAWDVLKWMSISKEWNSSNSNVELSLDAFKTYGISPVLSMSTATGWRSESASRNIKPRCLIKWRVE